jgi:predicted TIM-barrel fold metal-dependent hydrolase
VEIVTHQANDHYVTRAEWDRTRQATQACAAPGRFVPILGCEWSAFTKDGGDRNVFYASDEPRLRRSDRFFLKQDPDPEPDLRTASEFLAAFRDLDVLVNMHVGGRMTNLDWHEPAIERLCEVHSTHGTVEWFVRDALSRGYRFGVTAGTTAWWIRVVQTDRAQAWSSPVYVDHAP